MICCIKYLCVKIFGLFCCFALDFYHVYLDYGAFLFQFKGADNGKKGARGGSHCGRGGVGIVLIPGHKV